MEDDFASSVFELASPRRAVWKQQLRTALDVRGTISARLSG
jgi:hypothetical protein